MINLRQIPLYAHMPSNFSTATAAQTTTPESLSAVSQTATDQMITIMPKTEITDYFNKTETPTTASAETKTTAVPTTIAELTTVTAVTTEIPNTAIYTTTAGTTDLSVWRRWSI